MNAKSKKLKMAMEILKQAMIQGDPKEPGSYAYAWHANISMAIFDSLAEDPTLNELAANREIGEINNSDLQRLANNAARRTMKICFDVETSDEKT